MDIRYLSGEDSESDELLVEITSSSSSKAETKEEEVVD